MAAQRRRIQSRHNRQGTLQNAWDAWNDLVSAEQELTTLPVVDSFPSDGINRLEALEERVRTARREYESASLRVTEAEGAAKVRTEHEAIIKQSADIRRLQNGRTAFDGSIKDLPERKAELEGHMKTLADTLNDLGPDWDEARLEEFDLSIAVRQEIAQHRDRLREASAEHLGRRSELVQVTTALEEAIEAESKARREFEATARPNHNSEQLQERRTLIRTASAQLGGVGPRPAESLKPAEPTKGGCWLRLTPTQDQSRVWARKDRRPFHRSGGNMSSLRLGIAAIRLCVSCDRSDGVNCAMPAFSVVLALAGIVAYRLISRRISGNDHSRSNLTATIRHLAGQAEKEVSALESQLNETVGRLGIDEITERALITAEGSLDAEASKLAEWDSLSRTLREASELTKQRKARKAMSEEAVEQASHHLKARNSEWQAWLTERGLLDTFTPETAEVLQGQVELGRSRLGDVRSWQLRIKAIEKDIDEYVEAVVPLATAFDVTFDRKDSRTVAAAADRLVELLESVQESVRKRDDSEAELEEAELQLEGRKNDLEKAEEELGQLLQSGGAEDAEEFRARADLSERRTSLEVKERSAHDRLQRLSGPGEALERLKADLTNADPQSIDDAIAALEEERTTADAQREELSTDRGSFQTELERLVGEGNRPDFGWSGTCSWSRSKATRAIGPGSLSPKIYLVMPDGSSSESVSRESCATPRNSSPKLPMDDTGRCTLPSVSRRSQSRTPTGRRNSRPN